MPSSEPDLLNAIGSVERSDPATWPSPILRAVHTSGHVNTAAEFKALQQRSTTTWEIVDITDSNDLDCNTVVIGTHTDLHEANVAAAKYFIFAPVASSWHISNIMGTVCSLEAGLQEGKIWMTIDTDPYSAEVTTVAVRSARSTTILESSNLWRP